MPSVARQEFIFEGLRAIVETVGPAALVSGSLLEPEEGWFPDAWSPDEAGVHRLLRRLMYYAGLGDAPLSVDGYVLPEEGDDEFLPAHAVAYFQGIEDGRYRFGVKCTAIDDPEYLVGVLGHEVAHAYRAFHGLVVEDRDEEEQLTDLTTIALGFGIFCTNNAYRRWTYGYVTSLRRAGYLSPEEMAFALAVWVYVRSQPEERKTALRWLEPLQRSMFVKVTQTLPSLDVHGNLALGREALARPSLPPMLGDAPAAERGAEPIDFAEKRSNTFRVRVPRKLHMAIVLGLGSALGSFSLLPLHFTVAVTCGGIAAGWLLGAWLQRDDCARCEFRIPPLLERCPRCGAHVQGVIESAEDRVAALETLRKERVRRRKERRAAAEA